jgi:DNA-binding winged helix-turn-helix (wHTH) protein/predicted ATPase
MDTDQLNKTRQLQFGPFALGGEPDCLRRGPEPIKLRPKSLQMLRYLSERPGQFVSKDELLDRVWNGRIVSDSGLRLCVGEIRAALGDDAKIPHYLETIVGEGYRFLEGAEGKAPYPDTTGPIVGRDAELRRLDDSYRLAVAGHTQFALLGGEPGIGKTTLVNSFLDLTSRDHDADVIQGQCIIHHGKQEAYGPMLEAIAAFWHDKNDTTGLIREFERHAPGWLLQMPEMLDAMLFERVKRRAEGMSPGRMVREFCQLVATLVEKKPLIIVVEDLHWADVSTIDLLASLAEHDNLPLMILGTYRPADAVLYCQSLRDTVKELKGRGLCQELLLELLTESDLASYLSGRLNGEVSDDLTERLYRRIDGNPLFMVKLVEELIRTQSLVCHDGLWCVGNQAGMLETDIPESLQSLISRYLEALPQAHREMLEVASVVGMDFSAAAMTDVLAKTVEEIESTCENLSTASQFIEAGKLLTWPDGTLTGSYRFQHHLYLEVIYSQIAEARQARIHLKIGKRLEAGYGKRASEIAASLASHFKLGHDLDRAIGYCRLSAEQALGRHAYSIAIDELRAVLDNLGQIPETTERNQKQLDCLILLGSTLIAVKGYTLPEVEQTFSHALEICDSMPDSEMKFSALWNLAGFHIARGELARSRPLIERAVGMAKESANPDLGLLADDALAQQFFFEGDFKNASECSARVLALYDTARHGKLAEAYSQEDPAQICAGIDVIASWLLGFQDQSLACERLVRELSVKLNNPHSTAFGLVLCAIASQLRRDPFATQEYADELIELAERYGLHWKPIALVLKGWAMAKQKPGVENLEMIENGLSAWRQAGVGVFIPYCLGLLAETHRGLGQIPQARTAVTEALSILAQTREGWYESELHRLQGELILQAGADQQDAEQSFVQSLEIACNCQALVLELYAAVSLSQLWIEQDRSLEVPELLQPIIARFNEDSDNDYLDQARKLVAINC